MCRYTSLVHMEQLEMAQQLVEGYGSIQTLLNLTNNEKLYSITTHDSHQTTMKAVTSTETKDSNVSLCLHSVR